MPRKLFYSDVKNYIESYDYELLSEEFKNSLNKIKIGCPAGHEFKMTFAHFKRGQRCPKCSINNKKNIIGNKRWCNKCKSWKNIKEFNWLNKKRNLYQPVCKECVDLNNNNYYLKNENKIKNNASNYYYNNKEIISIKNKIYRNSNKEKLDQKKREYLNSPLEYNSNSQMRKDIEKYEEIRESENDNVESKCAYCGRWFEPTKQQIQHRLAAINGRVGAGGSEQKLYCSNKCKKNCSIYNQKLYERGYQPTTPREVQPELRKMIFARDEYTCQRCGYHEDDLDTGIHCHHFEGIQWNPLESADIDNCITLCKICHNKAHSQNGCRYNDLKCV